MTFQELTATIEENARLKGRIAALEAIVRDLTAERDVLAELATARDVADYRAWLAEDVRP